MKLTLICLLAGTLILTGCVQKPVPTPDPTTVKEYLNLHKYKIWKKGNNYFVQGGEGRYVLDYTAPIKTRRGNVHGEDPGALYEATIKDVTFIINADGSMKVKVKNIGTALLKFDAAGNLSSIEDP